MGNAKRKFKKKKEREKAWHLCITKEIHPKPFLDLARDLSGKQTKKLIDALGEDLKRTLRKLLDAPKAQQEGIFYEKCYRHGDRWCCQTCWRDPLGNEICEPPRCTPLPLAGTRVLGPLEDLDTTQQLTL